MSGANFWGSLVRELRLERGITQRGLALATGVNRNSLRNIERGAYSGDMETMELLLGHLGYEIDAIAMEVVVHEKTTCHSAA